MRSNTIAAGCFYRQFAAAQREKNMNVPQDRPVPSQARDYVVVCPHYGAFESTKIHGCGTDILETTRHIERWRHDLGLLHAAGIHDLRYSAPWHRLEHVPGSFDFRWMDGPMRFIGWIQ
jgi:hypothetical protein